MRFIYVRPLRRYLSLHSPRDVIERAIVDEIDLGGWDLRKALGLLVKSNAVIAEWIASPIRYRDDDPLIARIAALAEAALDPARLAHHYASLGRNAAKRWLGEDGPVPVKKYFYALRPALAIRWLLRGERTPPPMNLTALIEADSLAPGLRADIAALVAAKRRTNERANAARLPAIDALIHDALDRAAEIAPRPAGPWLIEQADAIFADAVGR